MKTRLPLLVPMLSLAVAGPAAAHHSFAMYDRDKTVTLLGVVKDYSWTSPHISIHVLSEKGKAGPITWAIEGSSPTVLARGGWTSTLLRPGDKISIGLHPRKDGSAGGLLADEQQILVNGQPAKGVLWLNPPGKETYDQ
jgi:hypothetical protein